MSVERLLSHFQDKVSLVVRTLTLRDTTMDTTQDMLLRVQTIVSELEFTLHVLQKELRTQKQALHETQLLKTRVQNVLEQITYTGDHLPTHLPKPAETRSVKPAVEPPSSRPTQIAQPAPQRKPSSRPPAPTICLLTVAEYQDVPKYMKGRITYDQMSHAVEEINKTLAAKHQILTTPRQKQTLKIKNQIVEYKEQESSSTDGYFFITDADITSNSRLRLDTTGRNILTILRHCGRLRELKRGRSTKYLITPTQVW